ncbi:MAG: major tail protein [Clostridia bacterium]|nr:major tail protein [Clostridia bacterium]
MAQYKACFPIIAKLKDDGTYSDAVILGKMIKTDVSPKTTEGKLYGDDSIAEDVKEATGADVTLNTTTIPSKAYPILFGTTVGEDGTEDYSTDDNGSYVGYGYVTGEIVNNKSSYKLTWLPKVKFALPPESVETKGENITFTTPSISGFAYPTGEKNRWRQRKPFSTAAEAIAALKTLANYTTPTE